MYLFYIENVGVSLGSVKIILKLHLRNIFFNNKKNVLYSPRNIFDFSVYIVV